MLNWLNSLKKDITNNVVKFLEVLEIDFKNQIKICVSGNSYRVTTITTLKEVLNIKKFNAGVILFSEDLENIISYKNRSIDKESLDFHLGCIKTIAEENNLEISYYEALFLAGLNFFREQKAPIIIVDDSFSFIKDIEYNHYLFNGYNGDYSYSKIDPKDLYLYKSELCSFSYNNLDYDVPNYGSFSAYSYCLALKFLEDFYPEIKQKKIKKIINDLDSNFISERVNFNPRVILHLAFNLDDYNYYLDELKKITERDIITISNNEEFNPNYLIKENEEIKDIINNAKIEAILVIIGNKFFVKDIRSFFKK
ncbi:MAG: hypothetical protein J6Y28_07180 [Acholeplasmatales bacterium]|nr:hypothetical protein [Acholeplasmatales bacterium]